jgi:outer membrane cobalamin receptor
MRLIYDMLNMTNREHATIDGYPLPGREHRLSLRINF